MYTTSMIREMLDEYDKKIEEEIKKRNEIGKDNYDHYDFNKYFFALSNAGDTLRELIPDFKLSWEK